MEPEHQQRARGDEFRGIDRQDCVSVHIHPDWGDDSPANGNSPFTYGIPYNIVHGNSTTKISVVIDDYASQSDIVPGADSDECGD